MLNIPWAYEQASGGRKFSTRSPETSVGDGGDL